MTTRKRNFGYISVLVACLLWVGINIILGDYIQAVAWVLMALAAALELEPSGN